MDLCPFFWRRGQPDHHGRRQSECQRQINWRWNQGPEQQWQSHPGIENADVTADGVPYGNGVTVQAGSANNLHNATLTVNGGKLTATASGVVSGLNLMLATAVTTSLPSCPSVAMLWWTPTARPDQYLRQWHSWGSVTPTADSNGGIIFDGERHRVRQRGLAGGFDHRRGREPDAGRKRQPERERPQRDRGWRYTGRRDKEQPGRQRESTRRPLRPQACQTALQAQRTARPFWRTARRRLRGASPAVPCRKA